MNVPFRIVIALAGISLLVTACGPAATPEVIRDFSRSYTLTAAARPTLAPTGPTRTPTLTSTPYSRPTDSAEIDPAMPIVKVGEETITLGQFRARVRFERFRVLNNARRIVETLGIENFNFSKPNPAYNDALRQVSSIFNTLANSDAFGRDIYDVLVREAVVRREFARRGLTVPADAVAAYWIRQFDLQLDKQARENLPSLLASYVEVAQRYSGLTEAEIEQIAETAVKADLLRPLIGEEFAVLPAAIQYKVKRVISATEQDAQAALKALQAGESFRSVACRYSTDPAALGNGGALGFVTRGGLTAGLTGSDQVFRAETGAVVGPLASPLGYHLYKINARKQNADGDTLVDVQTILVATEALGKEVRRKLDAGEDFVALACQYSLDNTGGNGGDYGYVGDKTLPNAVVLALNPIRAEDMKQFVGPIRTDRAWEVLYVEDRKLDVPAPADIEAAKQQAFVKWLEDQGSSSLVTALTEDWQALIPGDPIPRDVAPFMIEENFGLPTPVPSSTRTPTPLPGTPAAP